MKTLEIDGIKVRVQIWYVKVHSYLYIIILHVQYVYIHIMWFSFPDVCYVFCERDTAGQERYQTITKQYYRRAQVIPPYKQSQKSSYLFIGLCRIQSLILFWGFCIQGIIFVYDITNEPSFQHIAKWASDVDEVSQQALSFPSLTLVALHSDSVSL